MKEIASDIVNRAKMKNASGVMVDQCYAEAKREYVESQRSMGIRCPDLYDQFIDDLCEALKF